VIRRLKVNSHPHIFRFNALWLAAVCYANPFILMGKLFLVYAQFFLGGGQQRI
jgi:hypothetical protein